MRGTTFTVMLAIVLALGGTTPVRAFELSHYFPALMHVDDFFLPPPEAGQLVYAQYNAYYGTDTFRNHNGDKVDSITVTGPLGRPISVHVSADINNFYLAPSVVWAPHWSILGARYGGFIALPIGNPSLEADLNTVLGRGKSANEGEWGVGDVYVQPLWLMWSFPRFDVEAAYGFDAPSGKYSNGSPDNVGLGFWEHQLQSGIRYHFDAEKTLSAVLAGTFEIGQEKEDVDITPGSHFTLNWGVRKNFLDNWAQFGVLGYDTWQTTDDTGSAAPPPSQRFHDEVHAAGFQLGIPKYGLAIKYMHEFAARDRFEGQIVTVFFALPLDVIGQKVGVL
jgi:hypothetical protein